VLAEIGHEIAWQCVESLYQTSRRYCKTGSEVEVGVVGWCVVGQGRSDQRGATIGGLWESGQERGRSAGQKIHGFTRYRVLESVLQEW
jgi:hypothetical protein